MSSPISNLKSLGLAIILASGSVTVIAAPAGSAALPALQSIAEGSSGVTEVRYRGRGGGGGRYYGGGYGYGYGYYAPPVVYAAPVVVYGSSYCANLRHKARATGSRYWWNRYRNEC